MARISGVNIPTNKRIHVALTYIFGIGPKIAENICTEASIDISKRVNQLNDDEVNKIRKITMYKILFSIFDRVMMAIASMDKIRLGI